MAERKYAYNDWENLHREADQRSAAEVPGFAARTVLDDTIGKLFAVRQQLRTPLPDDLDGLLDDLEALAEQIVDLALDEDAPEINNGEAFPAPELMNHTDHLKPSAAGTIYWCSCGQPCL